MTNSPPLSSKQVAKRLRVSVRTVQRRAEDGEIPALKMDGETGAYLFDPRTIEALAHSDQDAS